LGNAAAFVIGAASVPVPDSNCYALDNSSRLVDFSSWIGHPFEYDGKEFDLVVRFCKDVETRGQAGYVDFGRFDPLSYFVSSSENFDFVQGFYHGDLSNCEQSYDKLGRTAQVNIICGNCSDGRCKGVFASGSFLFVLLHQHPKCFQFLESYSFLFFLFLYQVDLDAYVVSPKIQLVELLSTWLFHVRNLVRGCLRDLQSVCILAHGKLSIMG
jgi:hypothetical protein